MSNLTKMRLYQFIAAIIVVFVLYRTRETWLYAAPIALLSILFTLLLSPFCSYLQSRHFGTGVAAAIGVLSLLGLVLLILLAFVPYLAVNTANLLRRVTPSFSALFAEASELLSGWGIEFGTKLEPVTLIASALKPLGTGIAKSSAAIIGAAGQFLFSFLATFYLLVLRRDLCRHILLIVPYRWRGVFLSMLAGCKTAVLSYFSGILKTSLFVSIAMLFGLLIIGVEDALILSLFMGLFEIIPYVGPILATIPILLSAFPLGMNRILLSLGLVLLVQQLESNVIGPYFTASSSSIHPFAAIICVFLGGSLFGLAGIMLSVPIVLISRSIWWSIRSASFPTES